MAWLVDWGVDAGTTSSLCVGGRQEGLGVFEYSPETLSHTLSHSLSQPATQVRQTKRSSILQEGQHAPGGWGIIPLHRVGGVGGGRSTRVTGLCLSSRASLH